MEIEYLDIVDEKDNVIGKELRKTVHSEGLRHREVHVWFFNNKGQVLFQKRGMDVDSSPGLFDASAGGHVDLGKTYEQSAINEVKEETGLNVTKKDLIFLDKVFLESIDSIGSINKAFKATFAYRYNNSIDELVLEEDKADGFEWIDVKDLLNISDEQKNLFVSTATDKVYIDRIFRKIKELV